MRLGYTQWTNTTAVGAPTRQNNWSEYKTRCIWARMCFVWCFWGYTVCPYTAHIAEQILRAVFGAAAAAFFYYFCFSMLILHFFSAFLYLCLFLFFPLISYLQLGCFLCPYNNCDVHALLIFCLCESTFLSSTVIIFFITLEHFSLSDAILAFFLCEFLHNIIQNKAWQKFKWGRTTTVDVFERKCFSKCACSSFNCSLFSSSSLQLHIYLFGRKLRSIIFVVNYSFFAANLNNFHRS